MELAIVSVEDIVYNGPNPDFEYLDQYLATAEQAPSQLFDVRPSENGKYELIWKIQTFRVLIRLGVTTINVVIHDLTDEQVKEAQILSSWEYIPVNPVDRANAIRHLLKTYSKEEIAKRINKTVAWIDNLLVENDG